MEEEDLGFLWPWLWVVENPRTCPVFPTVCVALALRCMKEDMHVGMYSRRFKQKEGLDAH